MYVHFKWGGGRLVHMELHLASLDAWLLAKFESVFFSIQVHQNFLYICRTERT